MFVAYSCQYHVLLKFDFLKFQAQNIIKIWQESLAYFYQRYAISLDNLAINEFHWKQRGKSATKFFYPTIQLVG
jgi:hypothetical protein